MSQVLQLAYHIAAVAVEVGDIGLTFCYDTQQAWGKLDKARAKIDAVYQEIQKKVQETSTRDLIKEGTSFATEFYLSGKALTALGSFYGKAQEHAHRLVHVVSEGIKDWSHVVTTPEGFTMRIADKTATFLKMSAERTSDFTGRVIRKAAEISPELPVLLDLEQRVEHLKKLFDGVKNLIQRLKGLEFLTFNFEHMLGMEIVEIYKRGVCVKQRLSGFHHDFMGKLEQSGFVQYIKDTIGPVKSFFGDVVVNGIKFKGKSMFPQSWNDEKVMEKILESFLNLNGKPFLQPHGTWLIRGITREGLEIESIIDKKGKIISSYPRLKD